MDPGLLARAPTRRRSACSACRRRSSHERRPASTRPRAASRGSRARSRRARPAPRRASEYVGLRERDVHRELAGELGRAALPWTQHADLVRGRMHVGRERPRRRPRSGASRRRPGCSRRAARSARPAAPRARRGVLAALEHRVEHGLRRTPGSPRSSRPARSRSRRRRSRRSSPSTRVSTTPSVVSRSARFAAEAIPFSRSSLTAASKSPAVSWSARLQSIIPALVASRSCFTIAAEISVIPRPLPRARPPARRQPRLPARRRRPQARPRPRPELPPRARPPAGGRAAPASRRA